MPQLHQSLPKYRKHRASGQAVVTLSGRDFHLGPYGTKASKLEYDRLIAEWLASGRQLPPRKDEANGLTINELILAYWRFAERYYRRNGRTTKQALNIRTTMKTLQTLYGRNSAASFGPLALKAVRQTFIDAGHSRIYINDSTARIKRMFRWAAENEYVSPVVYQGLQAVAGLKRGRSEARETDPVKPVSDGHVDAIRSHVSRQVWAMVQLQLLTGMRSGEVTIMRGCDLDMTGELWLYRPSSHKTEHHGRERLVELGPRAQHIIRPFLKTDTASFLFGPAEAEAEWRKRKHQNRQTPLSCGNRPGSNRRLRPRRRPKEHYSSESYRRAIARACDRAFPPPEHLRQDDGESEEAWRARLTDDERAELKAWCSSHRWYPHQLRHSFATRIRKALGLEAARILLGHASAAVTEIYAEADRAKSLSQKVWHGFATRVFHRLKTGATRVNGIGSKRLTSWPESDRLAA